MTAQAIVRKAIIDELRRQQEENGSVSTYLDSDIADPPEPPASPEMVTIDGDWDLWAVASAVLAALPAERLGR